jgi:tetratricopeptide (TPR) repeat protein
MRKWILLASIVIFFIAGWGYYNEISTDRYCRRTHIPTTPPPVDPATSWEYIQLGDHEYERGNCQVAINNYYRAIRIDPYSAEAYNNRAFVFMKMHYYKQALADLNVALDIRPEYPHALMNRASIYNHYYNVDRQKAIEDYDRVIKMGKEVVKSEAVCGQRLMAKHEGNWIKAMWDMWTKNDDSGCLSMYFEK